MPRGAAVVYPKDAAQIVAMADIFPGARVVEAGVGSGALTCSLLRAVGPARPGVVVRAARGVRRRRPPQRRPSSSAADHPAWKLTVGDLVEELPGVGRARRPGHPRHARALGVRRRASPRRCAPGGIVCAYVATTTQLGRIVETLRAHGGFTEPQPWESLVRDWHVEGLAVRPGHKMIGHTGFLVTARRMAPGERRPGQEAPPGARCLRRRLRRPAARRPAAGGRRGAVSTPEPGARVRMLQIATNT